MTRKHFVAIAKVIADFAGQMREDLRAKLAREFADVFVESNSTFDRDRFFDACKVERN